METPNLSALVHEYCARTGRSRGELARRARVTTPKLDDYLGGWHRFQRRPPESLVLVLARELGQTPETVRGAIVASAQQRRTVPPVPKHTELEPCSTGVRSRVTPPLSEIVQRYRDREHCTPTELAVRARISRGSLHNALAGGPLQWETLVRRAGRRPARCAARHSGP